MRFQAPRGTEDLLPGRSAIWQSLEAHFSQVAESYGYEEFRTPAFEDSELFLRTAGETSDIVTKEMYSFVDKGDRNVSLKPEGTAPVMRAVIEHNLCPPGAHLRGWYLTQIFRYGRPGRGRLRQAHQFGCELLGSASATADAEVIEVAYRFLERIGLGGEPIWINSIGDADCRKRFGEHVLNHVSAWLDTAEPAAAAQARKNPIGMLDSKDPAVKELIQSLTPILEFLSEASQVRFHEVQRLLEEAGVPFEVNPLIVRGLDYYNDTVFEFESAKLPGLSIFGGGRYDGLVKQLGGSPTPCVGFGIGVERVELALRAAELLPEPPAPDAFVVQASAEAAEQCRAVARFLRATGKRILMDVDGRSLKSQLRQADKSRARFAILIGEDELSKGVATVRNLINGEQLEAPLDQLLPILEA